MDNLFHTMLEEAKKHTTNHIDRILPRDSDCDDGGGSDGGDGLRRGLRRQDHRGQAGDHERRAEESAVPQTVGGARRETSLMNLRCQAKHW